MWATTNTFAGMSQKQLIAQQSSTEGTFVYTHGLNDRYGNPMIEKIRHDGATAFVEHDPVTGNPLFLRDTDKKSVHMYLSDPVDSDIRLVKDNATTANFKEFDPYGARDEITTVVPRDVFDPFRYRFGLVWLIMVVRVVICLVFVFMIRIRGYGRSRILWMHLWIRLMRIDMPMLVGTR